MADPKRLGKRGAYRLGALRPPDQPAKRPPAPHVPSFRKRRPARLGPGLAGPVRRPRGAARPGRRVRVVVRPVRGRDRGRGLRRGGPARRSGRWYWPCAWAGAPRCGGPCCPVLRSGRPPAWSPPWPGCPRTPRSASSARCWSASCRRSRPAGWPAR